MIVMPPKCFDICCQMDTLSTSHALTMFPCMSPLSHQVGENIPNITRPYAFIDLRIKQGPNSLEKITEDAPVSIGELLGDIGGFWGECTKYSLQRKCAYQHVPRVRPCCAATTALPKNVHVSMLSRAPVRN